MTTHLHLTLPIEFHVPGSPASVNRYGTPTYRNWRSDVYSRSVGAGPWFGSLVLTPCSVRVRYFHHLDRCKDVDNILKAILDGLDGKAGPGQKLAMRVIDDDRNVEQVVSQRTKLDFSTRIRTRHLRLEEYSALRAALAGQAAVFVSVGLAPNHNRSVT